MVEGDKIVKMCSDYSYLFLFVLFLLLLVTPNKANNH